MNSVMGGTRSVFSVSTTNLAGRADLPTKRHRNTNGVWSARRRLLILVAGVAGSWALVIGIASAFL